MAQQLHKRPAATGIIALALLLALARAALLQLTAAVYAARCLRSWLGCERSGPMQDADDVDASPAVAAGPLSLCTLCQSNFALAGGAFCQCDPFAAPEARPDSA